jgi:hypothetical protein
MVPAGGRDKTGAADDTTDEKEKRINIINVTTRLRISTPLKKHYLPSHQ